MTTTSPTSPRARLAVLAACLMLFAAACGATDDGSDDAAASSDTGAADDHEHDEDADHVHDDATVSLVAGDSDFLSDYVLSTRASAPR